MGKMTTEAPTAAAMRGMPGSARKSNARTNEGRARIVTGVGGACAYAQLCTLTTAPPRGELVDTAK